MCNRVGKALVREMSEYCELTQLVNTSQDLVSVRDGEKVVGLRNGSGDRLPGN